jgi:hypothetical protein
LIKIPINMISKIDKYRYASMPVEKINDAFVHACGAGNLELAKYFLFDKNIQNAQIEKCGERGIVNACSGKHNEIVKFLLEGKELTKHVSVNVNRGALLRNAVERHNKELLNYLLDKKKKKINLEHYGDSIFISLMGNFSYHRDMIMSLIVDYELPRTQVIIDFLDEKNRGVGEKKTVNEWFEKRELMQTLQYVFNDDAEKEPPKPKPKKMKI